MTDSWDPTPAGPPSDGYGGAPPPGYPPHSAPPPYGAPPPFATISNTNVSQNGIAVSVIAYFVVWIGLIIAGGLFWFTKTNNALNDYWASIGVVHY